MFLSILMLIITAFYVLPVKECLSGTGITAVADMDDEKVENEKVEKSKELFSISVPGFFLYPPSSGFGLQVTPVVPLMLKTIVSPPPDTRA